MNLVPFRPRLRLVPRRPTRRPPMRDDLPDRWNPPGWGLVCTLTIVVAFVIASVHAYRDIRSYMPDWLPRLEMRVTARFELAIDGREGLGRVVDGDTLAIEELRIRLEDIDAPEKRQTCHLDGREVDCGRAAARFLEDFVAGSRVRCSERGSDRYGRVLAICVRSDKRDLGRHMVANGWAFAGGKYDVYRHDEATARRDRLGVWAGAVINPKVWRSGER